jgi:catechol 2,3-dioxygenase-like lactoylglutathione lyase family enzyme
MNLGKDLAYVALVTNDVAAAATVFGKHLGLSRTDCRTASGDVPVFAIGQSALAVFPLGHPLVDGQQKPGVHHIALAVPNVDAAAEAATAAGVPALPQEAKIGLQGRRYRALDLQSTLGVRTYLSEPLTVSASNSDDVERLDHVGIACSDNTAAVKRFSGQLGCELESQQTDAEMHIAVESFTSDNYGLVYHTRPPEFIGAVRATFITMGDCELEFLQSVDSSHGNSISHGTPGDTRQDRNSIARFIASRGAGLHHIAFKAPDINATLKRFAKAGIRLIDSVGRPGSRRAMIGFVHPSSVGGFLFHFDER